MLSRNVFLGVLTGGLCLAAGAAQAGVVNFNVSTGDYATASSWDTLALPAAGDTVYIANGGTATLASDVSAAAPTSLTLGETASGELDMSSGAVLKVGTCAVGDLATGNLNITGGSFTSTGETDIGKNSAGTLTVGGGASFTSSGFALGYANNVAAQMYVSGTAVLNGGTIYMAKGTGSTATIQQSGSSVVGTSSTTMYLANGANSVATYAISGGTLNAPVTCYVAYNSGSGGTITASGNSVLNLNFSMIGGGAYASTGAHGEIDVKDNATLNFLSMGSLGEYGTGTIVQTGGTVTMGTAGQLRIGHYAPAFYTLSGDSSFLNLGTGQSAYIGFQAGANGLLTQSGGSVSGAKALYIGYTGTGAYAMSGGSATLNGIVLGQSAGTGIGTLTVSNGTMISQANISVGTGGTGTVNLNGGTLQANIIVGGSASAATSVGTINFSGGTLTPYNASSANWIYKGVGACSVYIKEGGATLDTQGYNMGIALPLQHGGIASTDGGLTKLSSGTLTLSGANTYTGPTTIRAGVLDLVDSTFNTSGSTSAGAFNPVLAVGGADIQSGDLVFDYTGGSDPWATIQADLKSSFTAGWTTGQIHTTTAGRALGWKDAASQVTVMSTLAGDADLDGSVNGSDLNIVLSNYNQTGMTWAQGDFNYDGTVNGADLNIVLSNYNQSVSATAAVPEPSTLLLLAVGLVGLMAYAWRKRFEIC